MTRVVEEELYCTVCGATKDIPLCCGKEMERDGSILFCSSCCREIKVPRHCGKEMIIRNKVIDLKKEIFGKM